MEPGTRAHEVDWRVAEPKCAQKMLKRPDVHSTVRINFIRDTKNLKTDPGSGKDRGFALVSFDDHDSG